MRLVVSDLNDGGAKRVRDVTSEQQQPPGP